MTYGFSRTVAYSVEDAIARVTAELQKEGFGVLTTIDVKETMKKKMGIEFPKYVILGACNPPLAHRALQAEEQIGLLLPCNVIVYEKEGATTVGVFDPGLMSTLIQNEAIAPIAQAVREKLERVLAAV